MSNKDRKNKSYEKELADFEPSFEQRRSAHLSARIIRKLHPLGPRVLVRVCSESNLTDGGLYLPEGAKQSMQESILAEVIEVASALDSRTEEETNVSGVPLGTTVLILKSAGIKVPWDDMLRLVETREVLAIVDEISVI